MVHSYTVKQRKFFLRLVTLFALTKTGTALLETDR